MKKTGVIYYGVAFIFYAGLLGVLICYVCGTTQLISSLFIEKIPELWMALICPLFLLIVIYFSLRKRSEHLLFFLFASCIIVLHILYEIMNGPSLFLIPLALVFAGTIFDVKILFNKNKYFTS
jgi:hypothetical protein